MILNEKEFVGLLEKKNDIELYSVNRNGLVEKLIIDISKKLYFEETVSIREIENNGLIENLSIHKMDEIKKELFKNGYYKGDF